MNLNLSQLNIIELFILQFRINMEAFKRIGIPLILISIVIIIIYNIIDKRR